MALAENPKDARNRPFNVMFIFRLWISHRPLTRYLVDHGFTQQELFPPPYIRSLMKFIVDNLLVTVHGEEDYAVYKAPALPYVGVDNGQFEPSFQSL